MLIYHVFVLFMFIYSAKKKQHTLEKKLTALDFVPKKPTDLVSPGLRLFWGWIFCYWGPKPLVFSPRRSSNYWKHAPLITYTSYVLIQIAGLCQTPNTKKWRATLACCLTTLTQSKESLVVYQHEEMLQKRAFFVKTCNFAFETSLTKRPKTRGLFGEKWTICRWFSGYHLPIRLRWEFRVHFWCPFRLVGPLEFLRVLLKNFHFCQQKH